MAGADGQNLDLAQILATLASLPKPEDASNQTQHQPDSTQPQTVQQQQQYTLNNLPYPKPQRSFNERDQQRDPRLSGRTAPPTHPPQHRTSTPTIESATITEWKHGLRCINKIAAQNPNFVGLVQKLMKDQERNVKDWGAGRERLIKEQKLKREGEKTHRAALSLPGILSNTAPLRTPEREKEELSQYDQKVYRACRAMVDSQFAKLKNLGVPFFCIRPDLVLSDDAGVPDEKADATQETVKKITKKELLELQRKMLNHLMEMYGD
ncbi:hypothetical protein DM02DRAFT_608851 [Periconia macrospinosa]|uniref:Uncharacterized protein n=1 Tax=Periconia macrospinosa TaxID=97972 RepID=A0A2V1EDG2_9PLEO|nr:hypothetical protein DM02DRAFT_608851 [Periconia macrospinosa]